MAVSVLRLFLMVPLVGLQCVIVLFPDQTHLPFNNAISNALAFVMLKSKNCDSISCYILLEIV